jgi:hypothetical protein
MTTPGSRTHDARNNIYRAPAASHASPPAAQGGRRERVLAGTRRAQGRQMRREGALCGGGGGGGSSARACVRACAPRALACAAQHGGGLRAPQRAAAVTPARFREGGEASWAVRAARRRRKASSSAVADGPRGRSNPSCNSGPRGDSGDSGRGTAADRPGHRRPRRTRARRTTLLLARRPQRPVARRHRVRRRGSGRSARASVVHSAAATAEGRCRATRGGVVCTRPRPLPLVVRARSRGAPTRAHARACSAGSAAHAARPRGTRRRSPPAS